MFKLHLCGYIYVRGILKVKKIGVKKWKNLLNIECIQLKNKKT